MKLAEYGCTRALENGLNKVELGDGKVGVITASISYQYAKEVFPEGTSFLKLGLTYPLPMDLIRDFAKKVEKLYIIEELDPLHGGRDQGRRHRLRRQGTDRQAV